MDEVDVVRGRGGDPLRAVIGCVQELSPAADDAAKVDQISALEELKSAVAAAQATVTAAFVASQRDANRSAGAKPERAELGIARQVGLARRTSPFRARRYSGWTTILTTELPCTFAALRAGQVSEHRAMLVARETAWLSREHRAHVDETIAGHLTNLSDRQVESETKRLAYRLDPDGYVQRLGKARADRRVTLRPAPETMARLTALLPVAEGVASYTTLGRDADSLLAEGDERSRSQIMADLLVERVTGQAVASEVPVEVNLIMTDRALFANAEAAAAADDGQVCTDPSEPAGAQEPAHLLGYGTLPAQTARGLIARAGENTPVWIRRLFTEPRNGQLMATDSRRRLFTPAQRHFLRLRDHTCRTPWCDAPIRHADHVVPAERGGPTSVRNGEGLCAACNYDKQAPGWRSRPGPNGEIIITTPTGHQYVSRPPRPPGTRMPRGPGRDAVTAAA